MNKVGREQSSFSMAHFCEIRRMHPSGGTGEGGVVPLFSLRENYWQNKVNETCSEALCHALIVLQTSNGVYGTRKAA